MTMTEELRKEIRDDIEKCESYNEKKGSESLFGILVSKYSVLDSDFGKNISTSGKTVMGGEEFDYRQELKAIAAKLKMWLISASSRQQEVKKISQQEVVDSFIERGEEILIKEKHIPEKGIAMASYVAGPLLDAWMGEINIFNERYLINHPLHDSIQKTYIKYKNSYSSCEDMLGHLRALITDTDFFENMINKVPKGNKTNCESMSDMLSTDINRCQQYLDNPVDDENGINLYIEITSRYDSVIKNFGNGLYQYIPEQHFYDLEISPDTLVSNLRVLLNKMISYRAQKNDKTKESSKSTLVQMSNKVFIVHGHDTAAKEAMARMLEKVDMEAIILHEQPNLGNTIIEKIERYTNVPFAVVLYTECDLGRAKEDDEKDNRFRARQNVVFEHGYLIGRLGRERVCALVKGKVETPGDFSGAVYIAMDDSGAWKYELAKEMRAAGLPVDSNKL